MRQPAHSLVYTEPPCLSAGRRCGNQCCGFGNACIQGKCMPPGSFACGTDNACFAGDSCLQGESSSGSSSGSGSGEFTVEWQWKRFRGSGW